MPRAGWGATRTTAVYDGRTMIETVVAVVKQCCAPVFVVAAPGQALPDLPGSWCCATRCAVSVRCWPPRGLRAAADAGAQRAFVCAVDMPRLTPELITDLAAHDGADVVLPWDGRDHYLAGVYRTGLADRGDALVMAGNAVCGHWSTP